MSDSRFNGPLARAVRAIFSAPHPDPWAPEVDAEVKAPSAVPLCISCLSPQPPHRWLCQCCGFPTGDFAPMMHYVQIYALGDLLRRGVTGAPERKIGVQVFLVLLATSQYGIFAPVYWYWMLRRARGRPIRAEPVLINEEDGA